MGKTVIKGKTNSKTFPNKSPTLTKKKDSKEETTDKKENNTNSIKDPTSIIKWNLPTDLIIELLAFMDQREFEYLLTFDKRCNAIRDNDGLYQRLMVRRLERYLNPSLASFGNPVTVNVPVETLRRGLKLFENVGAEKQLEYAAYYSGKL